MENLCQQHGLLIENNGVIRVPFLIKGRLVLPPVLAREEVVAAFATAAPGTHHRLLANAQLLREPVIERSTMRRTAEYLYQVLPRFDPFELLETDPSQLAHGLYAQPVETTLTFLQALGETLQNQTVTTSRVLELTRRTSDHPDLYLEGAFAALQMGLDSQLARALIDNELAFWQLPGQRFLDEWVAVPATAFAGLTPALAQMLPQAPLLPPTAPPLVRAMPTRQLHITAGNAPEVPWVSALRLLLSKSAGAVKLPFGATLSGALLALAALTTTPTHPLVQHLSIVYWPGGDEGIETVLFAPNAFDRIVVWGAPDTVASVQARARFTKTLCFNPRYGVSFIGREAFEANLETVLFAAATDALIYSQKACTASQVQYVEGTEAQVLAYAEGLAALLRQWDELAPPHVPPDVRGQIKRLKRGKYPRATWRLNETAGEYVSGVVCLDDEFNIFDHPMSRLVVVRRMPTLTDALRYLHAGVSTVGVYPEARRLELRDAIAAHGVSTILPLGQCDRFFPGGPQDGMVVLSELVDWKVA